MCSRASRAAASAKRAAFLACLFFSLAAFFFCIVSITLSLVVLYSRANSDRILHRL